MVRFARITHPDNERVVEHGAVAFRDGVEPLGQVRNPLGVKLADRDRELVRAVHVADRVPVFHDAEFFPRVIQPHTARGVDGHHVGQPGCERPRRDRTLRLETLGGGMMAAPVLQIVLSRPVGGGGDVNRWGHVDAVRDTGVAV